MKFKKFRSVIARPARASRAARPRVRLFAALAAGLVLAAAPAARAGLEVAPHFGFNDTLASGSWAPLRIEAKNTPDPKNPSEELKDFKGVIRVEAPDTQGKTVVFTRELELPKNANKLIEFPVVVGPAKIRIQVVDSRGALVFEKEDTPLGPAGANQRNEADTGVRPTVLIAVDPEKPAGFPTGGVGARLNIQRIAYEAAPEDFKSYQTVKALVIGRRLSSRLAPEQLAAMDEWIAQGGTLVVMVPRQAAELKLDPWLAERLPAPVQGASQVRLAEIAPGSPDDLAMFAEFGPAAPGASFLMNSPLGPVAMERPLGAGRVVAFALDPADLSTAALDTPLGLKMQALIESTLLAPAREDLRARHQFSTADVDPSFSGVSLLPNIGIVTLFLISFMVVVGPLNFALLKRRRRMELAWFTIPGLSVIFFFLIYGYGLTLRSDRQHYASAEILHLASGSDRGLLLWNGIQFSPAARTYKFTVPAPGSMTPRLTHYQPQAAQNWPQMFNPLGRGGNVLVADQTAIARQNPGEPFTLESPVPYGVIAFYMGEQPLRIEGAIEGEATLSGEPNGGGGLHLRVKNGTGADLTNAQLAVASLIYTVPDIKAGETFEGDLGAASSAPTSVSAVNQPNIQYGIRGPRVVATPLPASANFEGMTSKLTREGAFNKFPLAPDHRPQSRVRLIADQSFWSNGVKLEPAPAVNKKAGVVEIELPLKIEGEVAFGNSKLEPGRLEFYGFDASARFSDPQQPGMVAAVSDGTLEVLIGAPRLAGDVRFVAGWIDITLDETGEAASLGVYNYATGKWDPVDLPAQGGGGRNGQNGQNGQPVAKAVRFDLGPDNVNPFGHYARLMIGSKPAKPNSVNVGRQYWGRSNGVAVQSLTSEIKFAPEDSRAGAVVAAQEANPIPQPAQGEGQP